MFKILYTILFMLILTTNGFSIAQWNPLKPLTGDNPVNYPTDSQNNNNSLQRMLANYKSLVVSIASASSISVSAGEVACSSTTPTVMRQNTSPVTATTANLDTGVSFSSSTTYYVYANCDAAATTFTVTISLNSTTPTGVTNYKQIGTFFVDGSGNIQPWPGAYSSNTPYQNLTGSKLFISGNGSLPSTYQCLTGPTSSLGTAIATISGGTGGNVAFSCVIPVGWWWEVTGNISEVIQL